ncbi:NAD(P)H-dependent oxidoreductase [bacterium]|nr:NAD(P)H-dependent oxidoreductase [bacterium]
MASKVLILYYSRTGNTKQMAELVTEGARDAGGEVILKDVGDAKAEELLDYDAIVIGSPVYYGSMAGEIKKLLDESVKFHGQLEGKVGAAFSSSANIGGGNETTILDILDALLIHGMVVQGNSAGDHYGPVSIGAPDERVEKQCRVLGKRVVALTDKLK